MEVKIVKISRKERVSKAGKPFVSLGIMTETHAERWLSGFENEQTKDWKVGDTVDINVIDTGQYLNFEVPKRDRSPAANNGATAELKNILMLKVLPTLDRIEHLLGKALDDMEPKNPSKAIDRAFDEAYPDETPAF